MTNDVQRNWHVPASMLERFARDPLAIDSTSAASVEQHLVSCGMCRDVLAGCADTMVEAGSWRSIVDVIDRPARSWTERLIEAVGTPPATARLMAATGQLRLSWAFSVALGVARSVVGGRRLRLAEAPAGPRPAAPGARRAGGVRSDLRTGGGGGGGHPGARRLVGGENACS